MSLPMLITPPGSELPLPKELGLPAGSAWRLVESLGSCFFVALVSADTFSTSAPRTLIMCWDSDLVNFLGSSKMSTKLFALRHVKSEVIDGQPTLTAREVGEIWRGVDSAADDMEVIVFHATDGTSFCGVDGIPVPASVRIDHLISTITSAAKPA